MGSDGSAGDRPWWHRAGGTRHGISRSTIQRGIRELESGETLAPERTRKAGAGRKRATATVRHFWSIWTPWWSPRRRGIPIRHCGGRARACARCRWRWKGWGTRSAIPCRRRGAQLVARSRTCAMEFGVST